MRLPVHLVELELAVAAHDDHAVHGRDTGVAAGGVVVHDLRDLTRLGPPQGDVLLLDGDGSPGLGAGEDFDDLVGRVLLVEQVAAVERLERVDGCGLEATSNDRTITHRHEVPVGSLIPVEERLRYDGHTITTHVEQLPGILRLRGLIKHGDSDAIPARVQGHARLLGGDDRNLRAPQAGKPAVATDTGHLLRLVVDGEEHLVLDTRRGQVADLHLLDGRGEHRVLDDLPGEKRALTGDVHPRAIEDGARRRGVGTVGRDVNIRERLEATLGHAPQVGRGAVL